MIYSYSMGMCEKIPHKNNYTNNINMNSVCKIIRVINYYIYYFL